MKLRSIHWNVSLMSNKSNLEEQTLWTTLLPSSTPWRVVLTWLFHISSFLLHGALDVLTWRGPCGSERNVLAVQPSDGLDVRLIFATLWTTRDIKKKNIIFLEGTRAKFRIGSFWFGAIEVGNDLSYQCFIYLAICLQDDWLIALLE